MSENQAWVVAELAANGDLDRVLDAVRTEEHGWLSVQHRGETVVLYSDRPLAEGNGVGLLYPVSDHVSRVVIVDSIEGGEGETRSLYYGEFTEDAEPEDRLSSVSRWFVQSHFDYYAARYGIDAAV
jgi:hypothetical protein